MKHGTKACTIVALFVNIAMLLYSMKEPIKVTPQDDIQNSNNAKIQESREDRENICKPFIVKENSIYFFIISQLEYDSIYSKDEKYEVDEYISDYRTWAERAAKVLRKMGFSPSAIGSKNMIFQYSSGKAEKHSIDTKKDIVALVLFCKGKKPKIHLGLLEKDEMLEKVAEYFEVEIKK